MVDCCEDVKEDVREDVKATSAVTSQCRASDKCMNDTDMHTLLNTPPSDVAHAKTVVISCINSCGKGRE